MSEQAWEREPNVACVVAPCCGFTFDAVHDDGKGNYSCPSCAELELRGQLHDAQSAWDYISQQLQKALARLASPEEAQLHIKHVHKLLAKHDHKTLGAAHGRDACSLCWAESLLAEALGK